MLAYIHNKKLRQIFEAGGISRYQNVNDRPVFFSAFYRI